MTTYPDARVRPAAELLMSCLAAEAAASPSPPGTISYRLGVTGEPLAGTIVDECCNGLAFVRVSTMTPSWSTPTPNATPIRCGLAWQIEFEIGIWRCVPIGSAEVPPDSLDWLAAQNQMFDDMLTLRAAACCFVGKREPGTVVYSDISPKDDPEGGCFGVSMTLLVDLYGRAA